MFHHERNLPESDSHQVGRAILLERRLQFLVVDHVDVALRHLNGRMTEQSLEQERRHPRNRTVTGTAVSDKVGADMNADLVSDSF